MRILIRGTNWIGDTVMTIPAIRKLRELYPDAELTLLAPAAAIGLFKHSRLFSEVVTAGSILEQIRFLRRKRFDLAVIFPNSFRGALIAWLGGAKRRLGYASQLRSVLLTDAVKVPDWKNSRHESYYYLQLIAAVEGADYGESFTGGVLDSGIEVPSDEGGRMGAYLDEVGVDRSKPVVAFAAGSTNSRAKRWPATSFAELIDRVHRELGANVILMGSKDDREISEEVKGYANESVIDITGTTDIETAAAVLSKVDLLISNDMGLAHIGPAVGTRTIVIFGPTNPVTTRPLSELATVVSANVECSPCMLRDCPIDHRCMTRVSPAEVFERAKELLQK